MSRPVFTFGQETFSSNRGDLRARVARGDERSELIAGRPHHVGDQRRRQRGELGQILGEIAVEALVGQPDRVDQAGGRLPQPRGALPLARVSVIVLETYAANGKRSSSAGPNARRAAIASNVPER